MDNPIKVIYKYKNENRKIQYQYFIFVGSLISSSIKKILKKIENLNFFDTLMALTDKELAVLTNHYGDKWYIYFFLTEHITFSIQNIVKTAQKRSDIIHKYGSEWYTAYIVKNTYIKKSEYNYSTVFENNNYIKFKNQNNDDNVDDNDNDYKINNINIISQSGGGNDDEVDEDEVDEDDDEHVDMDNGDDDLIFDKIKSEEGLSIDTDETFDLEELGDAFKMEETQIDSNPNSIKNLISKALEKTDSDLNDKKNRVSHFDKSKSNLVYDDLLKKNYDKHFVFANYIFKTDTIKTIKQKIALNIENNDSFSKITPYIIPSRMYIWSEYDLTENNTVKNDKIMLGQKWIKKNELLSVDIEPNANLNIYEKLRGNMKLLNDSMKKYGSKIRFQNDENNILDEYEGYYTNNEIFMCDIYNDIGNNYSNNYDDLKNLFQVYVKIYYYNVSFDEFLKIVEFTKPDKEKKHYEENIINSIYQNIYNDMALDREITNTIEQVKIDKIDYQSLLKSNFIIQAVIHINLSVLTIKNMNRINLYRIFDSFIVNETYPFIQQQINGDKVVFKFNQEHKEVDKDAIMSKWFENSPYGINFKIKVEQKGNATNKYIAVSLFETGRLEYKSTWKEEDQATNEDVVKTYQNIKDLIKKINAENKKISIVEPENHQFKYAFINTIQHFEFPNKISINHNDMSDFARYFFPYIAVVIDPRKRMSKKNIVDDKSKYGTYLRYKRISNFDNESKIENRIVYFLRNYEFIPKLLAVEISKQFNIIEKEALIKIEEVVNKYPLLKKSRKILKKLQNVPKFKPPGIDINIQGKKKENYKIRIGGARSQQQLDEIITFMAIILWLYMDTYIVKNPERIQIKNKLKSLTNIAKRRNKVPDIVNVEVADVNNIKEMAKLDSDRIGLKTKHQWARTCQKSADKNRRPAITVDKTFDKLVSQGYKLNTKSGDYERTVQLTQGKKKKDVTITAAKLTGSRDVYYTCSPEDNKEYMYVGFLSRSSDTDMCIPCCFKKNPALSKNKFKKNYHLQCLGKNNSGEEYDKQVFGDKLYILQDTNKMLPGRFGHMYKFLDYYFNNILKKSKVVKNNYLIESVTGYFMKFGSKQDEYPFLNAISSCLDIPFQTIKDKIVGAIENNVFWTYANSGDLKTQFIDKKTFIETLNTNDELDHFITDDIISIPGVLVDEGLNIYIFEKKELGEKVDFILLCKNIENILYYNDPMRKNIILIKEELNYYPIMLIHKNTKEKNINITSSFNTGDEIIQHIMQYVKLSCKTIEFNSLKIDNAKNIYYALFANSKNNLIPVKQYIDSRNKCKYLMTKENFIIPVKPSGILYHLPIVDEYQANSITDTMDFLENIETIVNINVKGFIYNNLNDGIYTIEALFIEQQIYVPVQHIKLSQDDMEQMLPNYILEYRSLYDDIDIEINKGSDNKIIDKRIVAVKKNSFDEEHYELFRYELSNYLNLSISVKNKIVKILAGDGMNKKNQIKSILLKITSEELFNEYGKQMDMEGGAVKFIQVNNEPVNTINYEPKNNRELCMHNKNAKDCESNIHCSWSKHCLFRISDEQLIEFIAKISNELVNNIMKSKEILNEENYFVLDVIDINNYTYRKNQKIIKSDNMNIKKMLGEIFGKSNIPIIGKRRIFKVAKSIQEENLLNPLEKIGKFKYQTIINSNALFRAYSNGIYWYKNSMSDDVYRNLGYYSDLQTELANTFKSFIYTWVNNITLLQGLYNDLQDVLNIDFQVFIDEYRTKLFLDKEFYYLGIIDLYILNKQHDIPIMLYDYYNTVIMIIDNGIAFNNLDHSTDQYNKEYDNNSIKIKYKSSKLTINSVPELLQVIY